jgi:hypothetical protein
VSLAGLRELVLAGTRVLGERASADVEHLVADLEPAHIPTDCHDRAGDVEPGNELLGLAQAGAHQAKQVRLAGHQVPSSPVEPGRVDPNEYLVVCDWWPIDLLTT